MHLRLLELRLLAALLFALWAIAALAIVVGYHPGGPADLLVRASAVLPALIAAVALVWPPFARGPRAAALTGWLAVGSALVLAPSIGELLRSIAAGGRQTLLPSPETIYATLVALFTTCLFVGLGLAREMLGQTALRRHRLLLGTIIALALTSVVAAAFGGATLANEVAFRDREPAASAWGPSDPTLEPPPCDGDLRPGPFAIVDVDGRRNGRNEEWQAQFATVWRSGEESYARVGDDGWTRDRDGPWSPVADGSVTDLETLDRAVVLEALAPKERVAAEDRGLELIGGARARHCRTAIGGPTALRAFPQLRWLIGRGPLDTTPELGSWRGEVDWWVFGDGQLGMATVTVSGQPGGWPVTGLQATLRARLTALDRDAPQAVGPPGP